MSSVTGHVTSIDGTTIRLFDGRITLDASRAVVRTDFGTGQLSDVKPGDRISALVRVGTNGALQAETIHILTSPDALLTGAVDAVDATGGTITVLGQQVRVTSSTVIRGLRGAAIQLSEILPRQQVRIELDRSQPGLTAKSIVVTSPIPDIPNWFGGTVEKIEGDTWTVRNDERSLTVKVTSETHIHGTPRVGDRVFVTYKTDTAGQHTAVSIAMVVPPPPRPDVPAAGSVTELTTTSLTIRHVGNDATVTFVVNEQTEFLGGRPAAGDRVIVFAKPAASGTGRVAVRVVRVSENENRIVFDGVVRAIEGTRWSIGDQVVQVSPSTLILGNPRAGDRVNVVAHQGADRTLHALYISKLLRPSGTH
jgi:exosome complex RNA-binding protein Csl4